MKKLAAALLALMTFRLVSSLAAFGFFVLMPALDPCDTTKHVCDGSMYAGALLGIVLGPLVGLATASFVFRRIRQRQLSRTGA